MVLSIVKLDYDDAYNICKLGQGSECCGFLITGKHGYECAKCSQGLKDTIKIRLENGLSGAKGTGGWKGCKYKE